MVRIYLLLLFPYLVFILCYVMYVRNLHEIKTKNVTECYCMKTRVSYVIPCMITTLMEFFFVFKCIYICFKQSQIHTLIITMQVFSIDKRNFLLMNWKNVAEPHEEGACISKCPFLIRQKKFNVHLLVQLAFSNQIVQLFYQWLVSRIILHYFLKYFHIDCEFLIIRHETSWCVYDMKWKKNSNKVGTCLNNKIHAVYHFFWSALFAFYDIFKLLLLKKYILIVHTHTYQFLSNSK